MVSFTLTIDLDSSYTDSEIDKRLQELGELIINKVKENIRALGLIKTGDYLQGWAARVLRSKLVIENRTKYAAYLEYGTYAYFSEYGLENFPDNPVKKQDVSRQVAESMRKGMMPFAPVRRVIYNEEILTGLVQEAFSE